MKFKALVETVMIVLGRKGPRYELKSQESLNVFSARQMQGDWQGR